MIMKRILTFLSLVFFMVSCGPSRHAIHVEMRHPSKSGIELGGKIVSVVYYNGEDTLENHVVKKLASGFAEELEADYGTGEGSVGVYEVNRKDGNYAVKDSLVPLVIRTDADLVFLMDASLSDVKTSGGTQMKMDLYCFDGMCKEEVVRKFTGNALLSWSSEDELLAEALKAGKRVADSFKAQWKHETYSIAYYDGVGWYEALARAEQFDWKGAMDIWFTFLDSNDAMKRACAEYNLALACYMLGDYDLARQWLDRSDSENKMPTLSDALRKRIESNK